MKDYKIKVNDEAESKEAQDLFFELGYEWYGCGAVYNSIGNYTFITAYPDEMTLRMGWGGDTKEETTLPQLRDLVVLHRNEPKDGNYSLFISDSQGELNLYKTSDDVFYVFSRQLKGWDKSRAVSVKTEGLKAIPVAVEPKEQGLISGADALRALADWEKVEYANSSLGCIKTNWLPVHPYQWSVSDIKDQASENNGGECRFRLKPRTINIHGVELNKEEALKFVEGYFS